MDISVGDRATRSLTLTAAVLEGQAVCYTFEGPQ